MTLFRNILFLASMILCGLSLSAQVQQASLEHDGVTRQYRYYVPSVNDNSEDVPLIFVLHGLGDSGQGMVQGSGFNAIADTANFIAVYPDALASFGGTAWNSGTPLNTTVDDQGFFQAILDELGATYKIDPERIFSCGFSMGGIMSHRLACEWNDVIKAVASQSGCMANTVLESCDPGRSVAVLHIHGTDDATVAYDGTPLFGLSSVEQTIDFWAENNACDTPESSVLEDSANDGFTIDFDDYGGCEDSQPVNLYTVNGMGHIWMNSSHDVSTSVEMWRFFSSLEEAEEPIVDPPLSIESSSKQQFVLYPNPAIENVGYQSKLSGNIDVAIYGPEGQLIRQYHALPAKGQLSLTSLPAGVYQLQFSQGLETWSNILVKQ